MHGIIFASLHEYCREELGSDAATRIFDRGFYSMREAHADEELGRLLERTADERGVELDELLRDFGAFTAERTFAGLYPAYFEVAGGTLPFLLTVEDRIHELVRATIPNARPPELRVRPGDEGSVLIDYASPRRLCRLLEGLVVGTGRYFGERAAVTELECMHRGAPECRFEMRVEADPVPAP